MKPGTVQSIIRWPHDRLRAISKAVPCTNYEKDFVALPLIVADLETTLASKKSGIAISAIQIGFDLQLFVVEKRIVVEGATDGYVAFVNPRMVEHGAEIAIDDEGCLSLPGIQIRVPRFTSATVQALDLEGKEFTVAAKGFTARVLQHELDHLEGKTIADYAGTAQREMIHKKLLKRKTLLQR